MKAPKIFETTTTPCLAVGPELNAVTLTVANPVESYNSKVLAVVFLAV